MAHISLINIHGLNSDWEIQQNERENQQPRQNTLNPLFSPPCHFHRPQRRRHHPRNFTTSIKMFQSDWTLPIILNPTDKIVCLSKSPKVFQGKRIIESIDIELLQQDFITDAFLKHSIQPFLRTMLIADSLLL
jgi:hypothetical protein